MTDLLWEGERRSGRGPKPALSLDRIVQAAIAIADAEGLGALSMQRVATDLGAGTMSLYRYVPGKEELINLMVDRVVGDPPTLDSESWRTDLRTWAHASHDVFRRHPWSLSAVTGKRSLGPNETAWAESALAALSGTGLSPAERLKVVNVVNGQVRGAAQISPGHGPVLNIEALSRPEVAQRFPSLMAVLSSDEEFDMADVFEFGLQRILDGIDALLQTRS
ncbi:MAG TPA: TetR family transcriptional regulator [Micromonosporaceae bacterium]|nr:TetR family transcriptional regulator [Micromonosporaceae bacterium]